jgi:hypothetical protein
MSNGVSLKISNDLVEKAKSVATIYNRSITKQIEYWAKIGRIALDNPDLPMRFIMDTIEAKEQAVNGKYSEFKFEKE